MCLKFIGKKQGNRKGQGNGYCISRNYFTFKLIMNLHIRTLPFKLSSAAYAVRKIWLLTDLATINVSSIFISRMLASLLEINSKKSIYELCLLF